MFDIRYSVARNLTPFLEEIMLLKTLKMIGIAGLVTSATFATQAGTIPGVVNSNDPSLTPPPNVKAINPNKTPFDKRNETLNTDSTVMDDAPTNVEWNKKYHKKMDHKSYGITADKVRDAQTQLGLNGYPIAVDGILGAETAKAIRSFQAENGITETGYLNRETMKALKMNSSDSTSDRSPASVEDSDTDVMDSSEMVK
jgi:hypothetical protein